MIGTHQRNLLVFADGTGNEGGLLPDESRSNVYKLFRATRCDPESSIDPDRQIAFYIPGVGTTLPSHSAFWQKRTATLAKAFGNGLSDRIAIGYAALLSAWRPGDRIYLFGFSRGAYTVRCLANLLEMVGIPTRQADNVVLSLEPKSLYALARSAVRVRYRAGLLRPDSEQRRKDAIDFIHQHACHTGDELGVIPYFVGVWDTVAAMGWSRFIKGRNDLHFPIGIKFARHAMAIDEYRSDFDRVGWGGSGTVHTSDGPGPQQFEQVWFAGNHSDIGGSYPDNESRLSDISLQWISDFISSGLPEAGRIQIDASRLNLHPACDGMMHDECMVGVGGHTSVPWFQHVRPIPAEAALHPTVVDRFKLQEVRNFVSYRTYRPANLQHHPKVAQFY